MGSAEFDWIARLAQRLPAAPADLILGIGDDAAILRPQPGEDWVLSTDTMVAGVHFPLDTDPAAIGHKLAAVNLSDLAAMGARPRFATLNLSLPELDPAFLEAFSAGLLALGSAHQLALVGGDTTRGPCCLSLTVIGSLPRGSALRRDGAQAGDLVVVSGSLGDAAAALALRPETQTDAALADYASLRARLDWPSPRVALGQALRGIAHACIDVSDGLAADLGHIATRSGLAALVDIDALPASPALCALCPQPASRLRHQLGGDDYELCFTVAAADGERLAALAVDLGVPLTVIGRMQEGSGVWLRTGDGQLLPPPRGWQHFEEN